MACTRLPLLASECGHSLCTRQTQAAKPEPLSHLQIAKAQVNLLSRERDELRGMVAKLEFAAAGQKRKACSDVSVSSTRTRDPRKRPRVLSPEEQLISDLKGQLSKATEESKERRDADARELASVQTCLKDMVGKTSANQELIRKLEADLDLKEKAVESKTNELSAAVTTISKLKNRVSYLEHDRQHLKADVSRYRARICKNQMYYESKLRELEGANRSSASSATSSDSAHHRVYVNRDSRYSIKAQSEQAPRSCARADARPYARPVSTIERPRYDT